MGKKIFFIFGLLTLLTLQHTLLAWEQKEFVIGTYHDPMLSDNRDITNSAFVNIDTASFAKCRRAYFNLLTGQIAGGTNENNFKDFTEYHEPANVNDIDNNTALPYALQIANMTGLKMLFLDFSCLNSSFNQLNADKILNTYNKPTTPINVRKALYGYNVADEPYNKNDLGSAENGLDQMNLWCDFLKKNDPDKLTFFNFGNAESIYNAYNNKEFKSDVVCSGQYPLLKNNNFTGNPHESDLIDNSYYFWLNKWSNFTKKFDTKKYFWYGNLSAEHKVTLFDEDGTTLLPNEELPSWMGGKNPYGFVSPNKNEIMFMDFSVIAYGAKGILYYTYEPFLNTPPKTFYTDNTNTSIYCIEEQEYGSAIVNKSVIQPKYYDIKAINYYITRVIGPVVMKAEHQAVYHVSDACTNNTDDGVTLNPNSFQNCTVDPTELLSNNPDNPYYIKGLTAEGGDGRFLMTGVFEDAQYYYYLVVNKNFKKTLNYVRLRFDRNLTGLVEIAPRCDGYVNSTNPFTNPNNTQPDIRFTPAYLDIETGNYLYPDAYVTELKGGEAALLRAKRINVVELTNLSTPLVSNNIYVIKTNLTLPAGSTLNIPAGVKIVFEKTATQRGQLTILGKITTPSTGNKIIFDYNSTESTWDGKGWDGIVLNGTVPSNTTTNTNNLTSFENYEQRKGGYINFNNEYNSGTKTEINIK